MSETTKLWAMPLRNVNALKAMYDNFDEIVDKAKAGKLYGEIGQPDVSDMEKDEAIERWVNVCAEAGSSRNIIRIHEFIKELDDSMMVMVEIPKRLLPEKDEEIKHYLETLVALKPRGVQLSNGKNKIITFDLCCIQDSTENTNEATIVGFIYHPDNKDIMMGIVVEDAETGDIDYLYSGFSDKQRKQYAGEADELVYRNLRYRPGVGIFPSRFIDFLPKRGEVIALIEHNAQPTNNYTIQLCTPYGNPMRWVDMFNLRQ
jgi:hypothetical protein